MGAETPPLIPTRFVTQLIGKVSTDGYTFDSSASAEGGEFVGLAIDEMNESDKTDGRIAAWVKSLAI